MTNIKVARMKPQSSSLVPVVGASVVPWRGAHQILVESHSHAGYFNDGININT